jgi:hypothetical protein
LRLPGAEQGLLLKAALLLATTRLGLWLLPFQALFRMLNAVAGIRLGMLNPASASPMKVAWSVEWAAQYMPGFTTCLTQALSTQLLLVRRGHPATLHIGVLKDHGGRLQAHAWVESGGEAVIGGHELERYTPLATFAGGKAP